MRTCYLQDSSKRSRIIPTKHWVGFVVIVTRKGGSSAAMKADVLLVGDDIAVIILSNARDDSSESAWVKEPEDVLSDLLDEILVKF